ncbi:MAG: hypothetical protein FJY36_08905 [Betaproteobacteria bacterium]|nr:hypothetical protein [Betaproteobacteria bacterium]
MKKFLLLPLLMVLALVGHVYWHYYNVYSDGSREGVLVKISRKGNLFKTYEAEILQPGFRSGEGSVKANTFKFSVQDPAVAKRLEDASGQTVKVHYVQYRRALPWRGDDYDADNAEPGQYIVDQLVNVTAAVGILSQTPSVPVAPMFPGASAAP